MDEEKLSSLLKRQYHLAKKPSGFELLLVKNRANNVLQQGRTLDISSLWKILQDTLIDSSVIVNESVDMTPSINLMVQIISALREQ